MLMPSTEHPCRPPAQVCEVYVTAFDLSQKTLDRHPHQSRPAETGHVTEDVRGIQTLFVNPGTQKINQFDGEFMQDLFGQLVMLEESDVTFQGPYREIMRHRLQIQGVMNIHSISMRKL